MTDARQIRTETLAELTTLATDLFARKPNFRSLMLAVAQYWNDEADDATHAYLVASERDTPLWPHDCAELSDYDREHAVTGEICGYCDSELGYLESWDDNGTAITGFAAYCHEHGSQEEPLPESYLPYAIARRTKAGVEIEIVGTLLRPWDELLDPTAREAAVATAWPLDDRATALVAEGDDLAARRVLADYLLEQDDPRGEYISLALADDLDADSIARRDALLEKYRWKWIAPLGSVVPFGGARFERGLLTRVEVWAPGDEADQVRGAPAWATVQSVRYLGDSSRCILHPTMRALREVLAARLPALETLARGEWPVEHLSAILEDDPAIDALTAARGLTRLSHLTFTARGDGVETTLARLRTAAWWKQLTSVAVLAPFDEVRELVATDVGPRFVIAERGYGERPVGWQFELDRTAPEPRLLVSLAGLSATSNRVTLGEHLDKLVDVRTYLMRSPLWQPTEDDVAVLSRSGRGISLA